MLAMFILTALVWPPASAQAQSRKDVKISTVGAMTVGQGGGYSSGMGSLSTPSGSDQGILRSSISAPSSFKIGSSAGAAPGTLSLPTTPSPMSPGGGTQLYTKPLPGLSLPAGGGEGIKLPQQRDSALLAAQEYLTAVTKPLHERSTGKPVTSLVPPGGGPYSEYMDKGETFFRQGRYADAYGQFRIANDIGGKSPESYLSLSHTEFASAAGAYATAAVHFRNALKYCPELPLVPLQPRGFFGDKAFFVRQVMKLEEHVAANPSDGDAQLLLAYFSWYDEKPGSIDATRKALTRALTNAEAQQDSDAVEAIQTFWRGMAATGKVSGTLEPTTRPTGEAKGENSPKAASAPATK